jgi:cytochrome b involved in lipid metabolism
MKNTVILGIVGLLIVGAIVVINISPKKETIAPVNTTNNTSSASVTETKSITQTITMSDVAKHNTVEDCWIVVSGKVYDLTSFIAQGNHPPVITDSCGKDGTTAFNTRGERNSPHPEQAMQVLSTLYKGQLAK